MRRQEQHPQRFGPQGSRSAGRGRRDFADKEFRDLRLQDGYDGQPGFDSAQGWDEPYQGHPRNRPAGGHLRDRHFERQGPGRGDHGRGFDEADRFGDGRQSADWRGNPRGSAEPWTSGSGRRPESRDFYGAGNDLRGSGWRSRSGDDWRGSSDWQSDNHWQDSDARMSRASWGHARSFDHGMRDPQARVGPSSGFGQYTRDATPDLQQRRGVKGYTRSDERIKDDLCERLFHEHQVEVSDVSIEVQDGMVRLNGTVPDRRMKHHIEDIASQCIGVKDVENRLRIAASAFETGSPDNGMQASGEPGAAAAKSESRRGPYIPSTPAFERCPAPFPRCFRSAT